ncbi:uncharacterized protein LOC110101292 [Dendrobium catenatum]|uniref:Reverse transcriptase Ty1/copia-type domain-containing protein n=1 Tax=Dendrobium nobile TaxID=94219 RepID=A0A7T0BR22_DENNO|nr:uncharacterized protein LOC110101292 [Dendrobium catenatum]QPJ58212.1 hypothetical protein [Dendrobium nobile]
MSKEFLALQKHSTWSLTPPPINVPVLGCKWLFKVKLPSTGQAPTYKARLVAQGFAQEYGINYKETFSPVAKMATVRILITIVVTRGWSVLQFDISNAFLHGDLPDVVYMKQPHGFVDEQFPHYLKSEFALKELGPVSTFLGIHVQKTAHGLFLLQSKYAEDLLNKFGFMNCRPVSTLAALKPPSTLESEQPFSDPSLYRKLAGSLMYLTVTRPDIAFATNHICQFMHQPTNQHFHSLKRLLRYIKGTLHFGLPITNGDLQLRTYVDAD